MLFSLRVSMLMLVLVGLTQANGQRKRLEESFEPTVPPSMTVRALDEDEYNREIDLLIAVRNQNIEELRSFVTSVSDPQSPTYGQYLSWDEVGLMIAPKRVSMAAVLQWLSSNDISNAETIGTGDFVRCRLSIAAAEALLETSFVALISNEGERPIFRSLTEYSIPSYLEEHIDIVGGVFGPIGMRGGNVGMSPRSALYSDVTPATVKDLTNSTGVYGHAPNNSISVAEFLANYYSPSDLQRFQEEYGLVQQPVDVVDGPNNSSLVGIEAQLDIEYVMACGEGIPTWFISTPGRHDTQEPFLTWLQEMESTSDAPWIFSVSFGDREGSVSRDYANQCDEEFMKFAATGRSIFFASGDDGVGCRGCPESATLQPNWPATSAFVTAVGGVLLKGSSVLQGDSISSGGFSNYFPRPGWQTGAVEEYLNTTTLPTHQTYNVSGRAVPDLAAFSENVRIVIDNMNMGISGTSCAAPMVAGLFGLINDLRMQKGMPTLGLVNPLLYHLATLDTGAFQDVLTGVNSLECCTGFSAAAGWDPITGWGLPNYAVLAQEAMNL